MATNIQIRNDTAANWTAHNPILLLGELGFEKDTNKLKFGNGTSNWSSLPYFASSSNESNISKVTYNISTIWNNLNPVLLLGEIGYDSTLNKLKIGDGSASWSDLSYVVADPPSLNVLTAIKSSDQIFNNNGMWKNITDMALTVEADSIYKIDGNIIIKVDGADGGSMKLAIGMDAPTDSSGILMGNFYSEDETYLAVMSYDISNIGGYQSSGTLIISNYKNNIILKGNLYTGSTSGNITLKSAESSATTTFTIYTNSYIRLTKIN